DRGTARHRHRGVVLLRTVDAIRRLRVGDHVIELGRRLVVDRRPALAAVLGDDRAAVVAVDDPIRIPRVDPEVVVIAVRDRLLPPSSASTIAYTRPDFAADAEMPILPSSPFGRPLLRLISVHVSPPSFERKMPLPGPPETSSHGRRIASQNDA